MAEIKNNFLECKMNQDIDDRLLPNGQYREAINLQISKSEGSDTGTLQNIFGTELILKFELITGISGLHCIGILADERTDSLFLFFTDYNDTSPQPIYNPDACNFIYNYNAGNGTITKLAEGAFLNFSISNPIIGVNLLEELLFWTDNRNQPRKINVITAAQSTYAYYTTEEQISVAKLNPYEPIEMYEESIVAPGEYETTMQDVVSEFLPSGGYATTIIASVSTTTFTIPVVPADSIAPYLGQIITGAGIPLGTTVVSYDFEVGVEFTPAIVGSLAGIDIKFNANPYYDTAFFGDPNYLEDKFIRFSYRFQFDDGEYSIFAPFTQIAYIPKQDGYFQYLPPVNTVDNFIVRKADGNQTNQYFIKLIPELGSVMPTTGQTVTYQGLTYLIKVVGYDAATSMVQLDRWGSVSSGEIITFTNILEPEKDDQSAAYRSTIVSFMQNKINTIMLNITLPCIGSALLDVCKITEVQILAREANSAAVTVIDSIPYETIAAESELTNIYKYNYASKKPSKTLAERELIRVYDKVPVKALAQEIISNRVVYGNYQDKHSYPKYLNYNVNYSDKSNFDLEFNRTSIVEYPNHSVKQNRTYQVGVVLSDLFGRQSGVILSDAVSGVDFEGETFNAASLYIPYLTSESTLPWQFPGYSLKILFNEPIPYDAPNIFTSWPGIYNGNKSSIDYNPLGWYSYKIVVKQTQQEYYNVYLPGALAGYPTLPTTKELNKTSHIVLINDNINKIPRDLNEVGPAQLQFRSSVKLYGRVMNENIDPGEVMSPGNIQYFPGSKFLFSNTIATNNSLFGITVDNPMTPLFNAFYEVDSSPLIARLSVPSMFGMLTRDKLAVPTDIIQLAVLETSPVESLLDIYWETTTAGLISELNEAILNGSNGAANVENFLITLDESMDINDIISTQFYFSDSANIPIINTVITSMLVKNLSNVIRTPEFTVHTILPGDPVPIAPGFAIQSYTTYYITINSYFYYNTASDITDSFTFRFNINAIVGPSTVPSTLTKTGNLTNIIPEIRNKPIDNYVYSGSTFIWNFNGASGGTLPYGPSVNGSNPLGGHSTEGQLWEIVSQIDASTMSSVSIFEISNHPTILNKMGRVTATFDGWLGTYIITIRLTDNGGLSTIPYTFTAEDTQ